MTWLTVPDEDGAIIIGSGKGKHHARQSMREAVQEGREPNTTTLRVLEVDLQSHLPALCGHTASYSIGIRLQRKHTAQNRVEV